MTKVVIADTSCLIILQKIDKLYILNELFSEITITREVAIEYGDDLPEWFVIESVNNSSNFQILKLILDPGEASAIA
jgi:predicted nucleic acid-binding protein